ncbi:MAG: hypothetical protein CVU39_12900 [Chloroflexi bacterium HGW-Chloroflexi-10]|nr:MAG: hypothetical protein CVU39_12900 [Chloroflexi bacterium HGW-Chloroflexi-10]
MNKKQSFLNILLIGSLLISALAFVQPQQVVKAYTTDSTVFINEIHYDDGSTDANEGVEIAGPAGTNLAGWALVPYNGSGGATYSITPLSGTITNQQNGYGTLFFAISGLQNGAPDGIALVNTSNTVVMFLSYEGSFAATSGAASGLTSTDIGVSEAGTEADGLSLQLSGTGDSYTDFNWQAVSTATSNAVNNGQTFGTVNQPIVPTCPASITAVVGAAASDTFSAVDPDGIVTSTAITSAAVTGISLTGVTAAAANGESLSGTLSIADTVAAGSYNVEITFTNTDTPTPQTAACTVPVNVVTSEPIVPTCPASISTPFGIAASDSFSASDADGIVTGAVITSTLVTGITLTAVTAAAANGASLSGTLSIADTVAAGSYNVEITFTNTDTPTAQTAACTVPVTVVNEPIVPTCPASISAFTGTAASGNFSASDADGTVTSAAITSTAVPGITLSGVTAASGTGASLSGTLSIADTTAAGGYSVVIQFTNTDTPTAQTATCTVPVTVVNITRIHDIQGNGASSPLVGTTVTVSGIVTADFQASTSGFNGYYLQEPDSDADADPATSEGVFVYNTSNAVSVGDKVRFTSTVTEFNGLTELTTVSAFSLISSGNPLPTAATVTLPLTTATDFEKYEGMLVAFPQDLVISEYFNFDRYGEIVLTTSRYLTPTAQYEPGSPEALAAMDNFLLNSITVDDGRTSQNADPAYHPNGAIFDLTNLFRGGDTVKNVTGIMDYRNSAFKIQPTQGADYTPANPRTATPEDVGGTLKVASFNVLNYFTTLNSRGANTAEEFARQRAKIIAAISAIDADVVGLMEIENNTAAIQDLVNGLNTATAAGTYAYIDTGPIGTDEIKVAMIYQPASVTPQGEYALLDSSVDPDFDSSSNRPMLTQSFQISNGKIFTVAVNHLKSKGSACTGDPDLGDGAGNCNLTRTAAAQTIVDWLETDPTGSGSSNYLIIGDLNAYDKEDPIDAIKAGADDIAGTADDYTDLIFTHIGENAYSYVFDGQTGYLDHALASAGLTPQVSDVTIWHINSDEPDLIDYDMTYKADAQDAIYAPDAYRASDHDPVIIGLNLNDAPVAVDDSYAVDETRQLTVGGRGVLANDTDAEGDTLFAELVTSTAHGTLSLHPGGSFTYTPDDNFSGIDTFTYKATDGTAYSNIATVTINVPTIPVTGGTTIYLPFILR